MRLVELHPQFAGAGGHGISNADGTPAVERTGVGLICDCPCKCGSLMCIPFTNPLDGLPPRDARVTWKRVGNTFETLTLSPSIRRIPHEGSCGWHGYIQNGEIKHCEDSLQPSDEFRIRMTNFNLENEL